ncbi:hypothetical protein SFC65_19335 [Priestia filamentosa]|uniref:hypothetical protein n=1 Tax=Priestia filamentosa TaxID=1402861 RepID=UPI0039823C8B
MKKVTAMIGLAALLGLTACSTETTKEEKTVPKEETKLSDTTETQATDSKTQSNKNSNMETYNVSGTEHKLDKELVKKRTEFLKENPLFELDKKGKLNVVGVGLGDSYESVTRKLGKPDFTEGTVSYYDHTFYIPSKNVDENTQLYTFVVHIRGDENDSDAPDKVESMELFIDGQKEKMPNVQIPTEFSGKFQGLVYADEPKNQTNNYYLYFQNKLGNTYQYLSLSTNKNKFEQFTISAQLFNYDYINEQLLKNDLIKSKAINVDKAVEIVNNYRIKK